MVKVVGFLVSYPVYIKVVRFLASYPIYIKVVRFPISLLDVFSMYLVASI